VNWFADNPVGKILASISGLFVLLALGIAISWTVPVAVEISGIETGESGGADKALRARQIAEVNELRVINTRPVFNESRLPVVVEVEAGSSEAEGDESITVAEAPDVRLTGIIITPDMKIATLTPADEASKNIFVHEGQPLIGEYMGWQVGTVAPRAVVLTSNDGQRLNLDLQVHEAKIKEPPKPVAVVESAPVEEGEIGGDEPTLSRAEQIRQRIAERREELRKQQEEIYGKEPQGSGANAYQNAIQNMMQNKSKDQGSDDNKDG